jgi:hypothetical protein
MATLSLKPAPRISLVTPSYNQGRFLEDCIKSVLRQGYSNLEYIIIDGKSTDSSVSVISRYAARLTHWVSEPDGGQADAINKGLRLATGELVTWLNADDFYLPGALRQAAAAYRANPEASFYFGNGWRADEAGRLCSKFCRNGRLRFDRGALIHGLNYILQPATFINRKHLVRANYLNPGLEYGLDSDLWIRLSAISAPEPVPACLAASREYGRTKTATGSFRRAEELRQIAQQHGGIPLTPGALCYYLDVVHQVVEQNPGAYPATFLAQLQFFWTAACQLMAAHGAGPDGFPVAGSAARPGGVSPGGKLRDNLLIGGEQRAARVDVIDDLGRRLERASRKLDRLKQRSLKARVRRLLAGTYRLLSGSWRAFPWAGARRRREGWP